MSDITDTSADAGTGAAEPEGEPEGGGWIAWNDPYWDLTPEQQAIGIQEVCRAEGREISRHEAELARDRFAEASSQRYESDRMVDAYHRGWGRDGGPEAHRGMPTHRMYGPPLHSIEHSGLEMPEAQRACEPEAG
jgi:hypothetical protein